MWNRFEQFTARSKNGRGSRVALASVFAALLGSSLLGVAQATEVDPEPALELTQLEVVDPEEELQDPEGVVGYPAQSTGPDDSAPADPAEETVKTPSKAKATRIPSSAKGGGASLLAFDPDEHKPYIAWSVVPAPGTTLPTDLSFIVEGPRTSANNWTRAATIEDCQIDLEETPEATCTGLDLDPRPGYFLVHQLVADQSNTVINSGCSTSYGCRYRVKPSGNPEGFVWTVASTGWKEIPQRNSSNQNQAPNNAWGQGVNPTTAGTYNFGAFELRESSKEFVPSCAPGHVYSVTSAGQLQYWHEHGGVSEVEAVGRQPNQQTTQNGYPAGSNFSVTHVNALGIGQGGGPVVALDRTGSGYDTATIMEFNTQTGTWVKPRVNGQYLTQTTGVALIAGAVCQYCGDYFFGGFKNSGQQFELWRYDYDGSSSPNGQPTIRPVGTISTPTGGLGAGTGQNAATWNGDVAFDTAGNLYIIRDKDRTGKPNPNLSVFTIKQSDIEAAAAKGLIGTTIQPTSRVDSYVNLAQINGAAFDGDGYLYVGSGTNLDRWTMPINSGDTGITVSTALGTSTDLASCSSPPTITLQKTLPKGRASDDHQFELHLKQQVGQGVTGLDETTTTTGDSSGLQVEQLGPFVTAVGETFDISEALVGATGDEWPYTTFYQCFAGGVRMPGYGPSETLGDRSGSVTIPEANAEQFTGSDVVCQFSNSPLSASIVLHKDVLADGGAGPRIPKQGWQMTANATYTGAAGGGATTDPAQAIRPTEANGDAKWDIMFDPGEGENHTDDLSASVTVLEEMQNDYSFVEGKCTLTKADETKQEFPLNTASATEGLTVDNVRPGDTLECDFLNGQVPTLQLCKDVASVPGGLLPDASRLDWVLSAKPAGGGTGGYEDASCSEHRQVPAGDYKLSERVRPAEDPDNPTEAEKKRITNANAYEQVGWECWALPVGEADPGNVNESPWEKRHLTGDDKDIVTIYGEGNGHDPDAKVHCEVKNQAAELTILKKVEGYAGVQPGDFHIDAASTTPELDVPQMSVSGVNHIQVSNTILVKPGEKYEVSETSDVPFLFKAFEQYTPSEDQTGDPTCPTVPTEHSQADDACWVAMDEGTESVSVEQGERGIYRFVNTAPTSPDLPLTGGLSAAHFLIGGLIVAALGAGGGLVHVRKHSKKAH